jgi:Spy/CpxP family protein refolding chaperone
MTGNRTRLKIWLVVVGVFVLGCVTGASFDSFYRLRAASGAQQGARGKRTKEEIFQSMKRDLSLSDQQSTEVSAIIDQTRSEYRALRAEARPRYDSIRQKARTRIRALLTPEQQKLFDARAAERDAQREKEESEDR